MKIKAENGPGKTFLTNGMTEDKDITGKYYGFKWMKAKDHNGHFSTKMNNRLFSLSTRLHPTLKQHSSPSSTAAMSRIIPEPSS
jgi:hypothetical protein